MTALHHTIEGQGPALVLSHALGCDLHMWDEVTALLKDRYTIVRYDHCGHGQSAAKGHAFTMQDLADDAASLIQSLGLGPVHFAGVSMGGMTAQALAASHPELVSSIMVANSAAHYDEAARQGWQARIESVLTSGMEPIADGALQRWFSPTYQAAHPERLAQMRKVLVNTAPQPYAHACEAVARINLLSSNPRIQCPTLVIAGSQDAATPPAMSQGIARSIADAQLEHIDAAHISNVEQPVRFAQLLDAFIKAL